MKDFSITGEIITGKCSGKTVILPRIDLSPTSDEIPLDMVRRQFPIRLGFAMTINKSQGQSFNKVGLILRTPVFSHGQLYVALSRVRSKNNLKISLCDKSIFKNDDNVKGRKHKKQKLDNESKIYTKNVVYSELFQI